VSVKGNYFRGAVNVIFAALLLCGHGFGGDLRITLPKRSKPTPVQQLNREGVAAIEKHHFDKARTLFYKAYLIDPDDPFTLNNLGYISELEGKVEAATKYYNLASALATQAVIDRATSDRLKGKSIDEAINKVADPMMQANRGNLQAILLLSRGRAVEADRLLQTMLAAHPHSPFALNNMGVAKEMQGNLEQAVRYYDAAARERSDDSAIVTLDRGSRGKPISEMAANSAKRVRDELKKEDAESKAARLSLQGVIAANHNDLESAQRYFQRAYALNPNDAFTLNNMGYVSELAGDKETAEDFYERAKTADRAGRRVGIATRASVEGQKLERVASGNDQQMEAGLEEEREARRQEKTPLQLLRRNNEPATSPQAAEPKPQN